MHPPTGADIAHRPRRVTRDCDRRRSDLPESPDLGDHGALAGRASHRGNGGDPTIVSKIAAPTVLLVLALAGYTAYTELKYRSLSDDLDAEIATYKRQHWERPVLRGQAGEGNAAFEAAQALQGLVSIDDKERDALAAQLFYSNAPLPAAQIEL